MLLVPIDSQNLAFADTRVARRIVADVKVDRTKNGLGGFTAPNEIVRPGGRKRLAGLYWFDRPRSDPDPLKCDSRLVVAVGRQNSRSSP